MKVVRFDASSNSCAPASIWWAKKCPGGLPRIARRDAELGKVVGILKYAVKEGERASEERSRSFAGLVAVGGGRKSGQIAREAMQPRKKYGDRNIGRP